MTNLYIELQCPKHGLERFAIKIIKKYNVSPKLIMPKFRTRPNYELSSIIIGRQIDQLQVKDYLVEYFKEAGLLDRVVSIKLRT